MSGSAPLRSCRVCGRGDLAPVIDLGPMPLVNNLPATADARCPRWPLSLVRCRGCGLGQLTVAPDPALMFSEYAYYTGHCRTMVAHAARLVERFVRRGDRVVEIASNDGYLLAHARARGARVLGVEPAANLAAHSRERGIPTEAVYFNRATAAALRAAHGPAEVIFALNVLAHVPDPHEVAAGIADLLAPGGVAHLEVPWFLRMIEARAFDTIYHEHFSFFTVTALRTLFRAHDLDIVEVEEVPTHGGSLHLRVARGGGDDAAAAWCGRERRMGGLEEAFAADFAARVAGLERDLRRALARFGTVGAFGAAAKGVVLLNAFGLGTEQIPWVADVSPRKQGRYVPGTGQPIVAPEVLLEAQPEACLLLPWNLREEIVHDHRRYLERGGRFILAVPRLAILGDGEGEGCAAAPTRHETVRR